MEEGLEKMALKKGAKKGLKKLSGKLAKKTGLMAVRQGIKAAAGGMIVGGAAGSAAGGAGAPVLAIGAIIEAGLWAWDIYDMIMLAEEMSELYNNAVTAGKQLTEYISGVSKSLSAVNLEESFNNVMHTLVSVYGTDKETIIKKLKSGYTVRDFKVERFNELFKSFMENPDEMATRLELTKEELEAAESQYVKDLIAKLKEEQKDLTGEFKSIRFLANKYMEFIKKFKNKLITMLLDASTAITSMTLSADLSAPFKKLKLFAEKLEYRAKYKKSIDYEINALAITKVELPYGVDSGIEPLNQTNKYEEIVVRHLDIDNMIITENGYSMSLFGSNVLYLKNKKLELQEERSMLFNSINAEIHRLCPKKDLFEGIK